MCFNNRLRKKRQLLMLNLFGNHREKSNVIQIKFSVKSELLSRLWWTSLFMTGCSVGNHNLGPTVNIYQFNLRNNFSPHNFAMFECDIRTSLTYMLIWLRYSILYTWRKRYLTGQIKNRSFILNYTAVCSNVIVRWTTLSWH